MARESKVDKDGFTKATGVLAHCGVQVKNEAADQVFVRCPVAF